MTIHESFAAQLRKQCFRFESIAQVCGGIGINRQQFNKYLAGQILPGARTMRKICDFLEISEEELLTGHNCANPAAPPNPGPFPSIEMIAMLASQRLGRITSGAITTGQGALRQGYYDCYFPLQNSSSFLIRSLVRVKELSGNLYFTRRTVFPVHGGGRRYLARGKHNGIVLSGSAEIYLLGVNTRSPHQLSFGTFSKDLAFGRQFVSGLTITRTGTSQYASAVCMQYLGNLTTPKTFLSTLGPVHILDGALDPLVKAVMTAPVTTGINQLCAPDFDLILPEEACAMTHASSDNKRTLQSA
jgi:transcriptional regulator with XRE-family HTH domain